FSVPTTYWRLIPGLAENFGNCLFSTPLWRWEKRFDEEFRNYVLTLPNGHEKCVWAKKSETFSKISDPTHYWRRVAQVVRFSGNFPSSLTWEKCQPPRFHYPLEEKRLFERKKWIVIRIFFSLIYLDRKSSNGRKNLKIKKALSQKRLCDRVA
ncbi:MAG: hypothetical protein ACI3W5_12110, partial [Faecousia sp.]